MSKNWQKTHREQYNAYWRAWYHSHPEYRKRKLQQMKLRYLKLKGARP